MARNRSGLLHSAVRDTCIYRCFVFTRSPPESQFLEARFLKSWGSTRIKQIPPRPELSDYFLLGKTKNLGMIHNGGSTHRRWKIELCVGFRQNQRIDRGHLVDVPVHCEAFIHIEKRSAFTLLNVPWTLRPRGSPYYKVNTPLV